MRALALLVLASCNLVVGDYTIAPRDGGATDGDAASAGPFHDITDPSFWTSFDLKTVDGQAGGYVGGAFDGRYVYFAPYRLSGKSVSRVARYEIAKPLDDAGAWTFFDLTTVDPLAIGYAGAVFAGGAVYFVPAQRQSEANSLAIRYDTQQSFTSAGSYKKMDLATILPAAKGYFGGIFDGRYVTFAPNFDGFGSHGKAARYDTTQPFDAPASWAIFDFATANTEAIGFFGAVYDGTYGYFTPFPNGFSVQFKPDAMNPVMQSTVINLSTLVDSRAKAYVGAAFVKGAVYFVPATDSVIIRYATGAPFGQIGLDAFDIADITNARGWAGAATDGQYVYFAPYAKAFTGPRNGIVLRYDTRADFKRDASYSTFDTSTLSPPAAGFNGAIFDGKFVYFVPRTDGVVARFDARNDRAPLPVGYSGSFL